MRILDYIFHPSLIIAKSPDGHGNVRSTAPTQPDETAEAINAAANRLETAREAIAKIDDAIAHDLSHFGSAQKPEITPTLEQIRSISFPENIRNLALETNTPLELFAGVSYFLAIKPKEDGIHPSRCKDKHPDYNEEFMSLCTDIARRHNASREILLSKQALLAFEDEPQRHVPTFDPDQHHKVVARMQKYSLHLEEADYNLSPIIADWIAAVNAGWQDMAMNDDIPKGPFIEDVTPTSEYDIRTPDEWTAVWALTPVNA